MEFNIEYLSEIISSTIRMCAPLLYCSLAAAICTKANIFHIGMEGAMLASAFFSIVVNYFTQNYLLATLAGVTSAIIVSYIIGFFIVKLKASPVVVGMAMNTLMGGLTTYLLFIIFNTKGVFTHPSLVGLPKVSLPIINQIPVIKDILSSLTFLDYFAFVCAILMFIFLYKTVVGYRLRGIGINTDAAKSLGTNVDRYQLLTISLSGVLCGLAGVLLSMGSVTLFIQNITSGRGYIALAANNLGLSHPLGVLLSSVFFGSTQALGSFLQNTSLKGQITASIPYIATLLALIFFTLQRRYVKKRTAMKVRGVK